MMKLLSSRLGETTSAAEVCLGVLPSSLSRLAVTVIPLKGLYAMVAGVNSGGVPTGISRATRCVCNGDTGHAYAAGEFV